jgi:DNA polymerase/3'-5' exonuclease PolX
MIDNDLIIKQFENLIKLIQLDIDKYKEENNEKLVTNNIFRLKNIKNSLNIIKKYPKKIIIDDLSEFKELKGIGKGTIDRIVEILSTGSLDELKNFKVSKNDNLLNELESIVGIGHTTALELINAGIKSIDDLKKKIKNNKIKINNKVKLGLKYYGKFFDNIPRDEIISIKEILDKTIKKINKHYSLSNNEKYIYEICGSFRREKLFCGDIDILISKYGTNNEDNDEIPHLHRFIKRFKKPIKSNNNKPLLIDDITYKNYETKYMGFLKYKDNLVRRIDIRYVSWNVYYSALLYFTGSVELNTNMRNIAKKLGYKLSEYGLTKISDGSKINIKSEKDIFEFLNMKYLEPCDR